jgi:SAM-dependent methyltransferase
VFFNDEEESHGTKVIVRVVHSKRSHSTPCFSVLLSLCDVELVQERGQVNSVPTRLAGYESRLAAERDAFDAVSAVHDLPAIFHYWSNKFIRPLVEAHGFTVAEEFFAKYFAIAAERIGGHSVFLSLGAGNCDVEVCAARLLRQAGLTDFVIECLEMNPRMLNRGKNLAEQSGVQDNLVFVEDDFNRWKADKRYTAIAAHQSLHHVLELEHLFSEVRRALHPAGLFVVDDMIGRNGHQRWPEALHDMKRFWYELPLEYRWNWSFQRFEEEYINHNCADEAFEGIRAQDILPLLVQDFDFNLFIAYGNIIDIFVDRSFGWNFDANARWDRAFIDSVQAFDEEAILDGSLTPTHMFAVMTPERCSEHLYSRGLSPERSIRKEIHSLRRECLTIATPDLRPRGLGAVSYSMVLTAVGGTPPYTWSAVGLPPGLALSPQGKLSGTIDATGQFTPLVTVRDCSLPQKSAEQLYTIMNRPSEQDLQSALVRQKQLVSRAAWVIHLTVTQVKQWCRGYIGRRYTSALLSCIGTPPLYWSPTRVRQEVQSQPPG